MQTEELAAQQKRRQERQARTPSEGYPGLSFGSGFSSNTMMRLRIIANELHNISSVQLKRAEGEIIRNVFKWSAAPFMRCWNICMLCVRRAGEPNFKRLNRETVLQEK